MRAQNNMGMADQPIQYVGQVMRANRITIIQIIHILSSCEFDLSTRKTLDRSHRHSGYFLESRTTLQLRYVKCVRASQHLLMVYQRCASAHLKREDTCHDSSTKQKERRLQGRGHHGRRRKHRFYTQHASRNECDFRLTCVA